MIDINWSSAFLGSIVFLTLNLMVDISQNICFLAKLSVKIDGTKTMFLNLSAPTITDYNLISVQAFSKLLYSKT